MATKKSDTFKSKMDRLEEISSLLTNNDIELENMIKYVEEAKTLVKDLEETLKKALKEVGE